MLKLFKKNRRPITTLQLQDIGFHGDDHLLKIIDILVTQTGIDYFVETGSNVGSTIKYFSKRYPSIKILSCEPDSEAYHRALRNVGTSNSIKIYNLLSQDFIEVIERHYKNLFDKKVLFWLDAHGYGFQWPLREEIAFITKKFSRAVILIDDFKVPDKIEFGYDTYEDQECSYEYIKDYFYSDDFNLYYPAYNDRTSKHHPLRGWGLISLYEKIDIESLHLEGLIEQYEK